MLVGRKNKAAMSRNAAYWGIVLAPLICKTKLNSTLPQFQYLDEVAGQRKDEFCSPGKFQMQKLPAKFARISQSYVKLVFHRYKG